jgi:hypothetical protein
LAIKDEQLVNKLVIIALIAIYIAGSIPIHAQPPAVRTGQEASQSHPVLVTPACPKPPQIDGILDDDCWKSAAHVPQFYRDTSPILEQTEAYVCCDASQLYVAFRCFDSHPELIRAAETQRDGNFFNEDFVGLFIDSQHTRHGYSQFTVSALGTQSRYAEGGTASNITWAGDWRAAAHRSAGGYDVEMAIPFKLLRHPNGARAFTIAFTRKLARETSNEYWPEIPRDAPNRADYFAELTNLPLQFHRPQPVFLPYVLTSAGSGNTITTGLDIKYPLTSGLTGLATLHPDFATIEQNVTDINFSYTAQYVSDQRPFFAEGSQYLPDSFYSPAVGNIDEGFKVTGKQGNTSIGLLTTNRGGTDFQRVNVGRIAQELNPLSEIGFNYVGDNQKGLPSNQVATPWIYYGWRTGRGSLQISASHAATWEGGEQGDASDGYGVGWNDGLGRPQIQIYGYDIGPKYVSDLGFTPNVNVRGSGVIVGQSNSFDHGYLQSYFVNAGYGKGDFHTGGFFADGFNTRVSLASRTGNSISASLSQGRHLQFRDHVNSVSLGWNSKSQYGRGRITGSFGTQQDKSYRFLAFFQGYALSRKMNMSLSVNHLDLGSFHTTQTVFSPQYRLTAERSIGGRIVSQDHNTNIYVSFAQKVRAGSDIYLLFGDPNSPRSRGLVQMKVVTPF